VHRRELQRLLDDLLKPAAFNDVAENGLQVEGKDEVVRVVCGVSANAALIDAAIERGADAVVVHHGIVWGGGIRRLDGGLGARVRKLMRADVSLFAYHLPLDAQPEIGNNAGLARALGVVDVVPFGKYKGQLIGLKGRVTPSIAPQALHDLVAVKVGAPVAFFAGSHNVSTVGLCTGGAPDLLHDAIAEGLDAYITGEVTEWVKAVAEESQTTFVAAGHHATERFGPRGLAEKLRSLGIDASFVDVENPA
jgi:dinuclear metal center YbgI/SA1388 family protein